jgi:thiamine-phosphate pyrophosphorylase
MRVIEDTARFVLGKDGIYRAIRCQRHRIDALLRPLYPELLRTRDTDTDAGRVIKEGGRGNLAAVVAANFKRVEESLRVLEEYTKFLAPDKSPGIKKIRFSMYRMEKNFDA